jgi:TonB family protein
MMEAFAFYLIKSVIWLTGFALVYILFLRNERFFELNRIFLLTGILAALIFPFLTISYRIILPAVNDSLAEKTVVTALQNTPAAAGGPDFRLMLFFLYLTGLLFVAFTIIRQGRSLVKVIRRSESIPADRMKLIKSAEYSSAFSFFSYVFVNPSVTEIEMREIMNHEIVHIRQKHWFDLLFVQLLCVLQWFNPVIWIYIRLVRENHEYIADKVALQRTSDPAIYRAALLNQIVGTQAISLVNSFNYSINKKRFTMMKNIISSPYRKMRVLLILPVFAIIFYAFAKPEYQYISDKGSSANQNVVTQTSGKTVKGSVVQNEGKPLQGAHVIVTGTTLGTSTDADGSFSLVNIPEDATLFVSYVGYKTKVIKSKSASTAPIKMEIDTIEYVRPGMALPAPPPPPPPPPPAANTNIEANKSMSEPKEMPEVSEVSPVGEVKSADEVFVAVEELPDFPGMESWLADNLKYPAEAYSKKITGIVNVAFQVTSAGKVKNVQVIKPVNPLLDAEAKRVISSMPDWKPGTQHGKKVPVEMKVPVEFKLK